MKNTRLLLLLLAATFSGLLGCKKETTGSSSTGNTPTLADKQKDTAMQIARELYLWYRQIPANMSGRTYADPPAIMEAIRPYSKEPSFASPVDRWSFGVKKAEWENISGGIARDFGLEVFFLTQTDLRVRLVEINSPAYKQGVQRGWRITKINTLTNLTPSNSSAIIAAVYESPLTLFEFQLPDESKKIMALTADTYQSNPVYLDTVYNIQDKNVGYFVYTSFLGDMPTVKSAFANVFRKFQLANIQDLIIDLRYNRGGYVDLQTELANYVIPAKHNGKIMMIKAYNDLLAQYLNDTVSVAKKGGLELERLFVIVSDNSASASELFINNVNPFLQVKLIGPSNTYGKPVGYFPVEVGDWYVLPVSSRSTNHVGSGNYFNGFVPHSLVSDGIDKNWGDTQESCLASAIKYINTGQFKNQQKASSEIGLTSTDAGSLGRVNRIMAERQFAGAIESPKKHP